MPMLVDEQEVQTALQAAASRPFEGVDPGPIARLTADYKAAVTATNVDARETTRSDIQREYIRNFYQVTGQRLPNWMGGPGVNADPAREAVARKQVEQWKAENPGVDLPNLPTQEEVEQEWVKRGTSALKESKDLSNRTTSTLSSVSGFLGSAAGTITDPINMLTAPFGASASAGILRTAMVEGALNAGSDAVGQAINLPVRQQIDPDYNLNSALGDVAAAGVGGAILGGGFKGLADVWSRARTGEWPSHVRDTGNVVVREAAVPNSRFEKSMSGDLAHSAAIRKSADDLISGRPVELPPEAFLQANARPGRVYDADGNSVGVRYEVVDAADLVTSHNDDLGVNPAFPQELQPRDRSRAMSQDQITGIASNLQPERLGFSTDAANGAPIVGPDGLVESGNGRVLALRKAYQQGGINADNYRNFLRANNFDVEGMASPVLIARRVTDLEDRVGFVTAANRSTAMRLGASEQALSDARLIDGGMLERLESGDLKAAGNQQFARGFMSKLPRAEQGNLIDKDGFLSQEGERRITSAMMGRAYGEPVLLGRTLEDTDNNIKAIGGALADSSGAWAKMRDAVTRGEIPAGMDITNDLLDAVKLVMKARDEGRTVSDLVNQAEMFGGPGELAKIVARAMFSDEALKRPVGRNRLAAFLTDYADEAMKNDAGPRLFGDALAAPDILKGSLDRVGRNDLLRVADERLTPEAIEKLATSPETAEASIMDGERLVADVEEAVNRRARWEKESERLLSTKEGEIKNALYHRDIGPIDVIWGEYDPAKPNSGYGLAKIAVKHPEVMANLPGIIEGLQVETRSNNRIRLESPDHKAVVSLDLHGEDKSWLITAFERDRSAGKTVDRPGDLKADGHSSSAPPAQQDIVDRLADSKPAPVRVDLGDGLGERDLTDILREADEEIAAAKEIEACTIGSSEE
ncbi:hypothetical protein GYN07_21010 [Rhizobium leguminosarum bv. viciae 248]|uniref:putative barnase/colicin E5 family endoribonuclease n=1 Tax=Rhizobium leguminosarum TaxID=384 RepID=UPI0003790056|nr:hypothetical protein [Rhizobium leguminosarum]QHW26662.1 hypothetical protein GYN07_21010 [Rhizobium leguminosarum bv. viciae 248]